MGDGRQAFDVVTDPALPRRPRGLGDPTGDNGAMQVSSYLKASALVAVVTIALKAGAWYVSGSVSLLSDAIEGLVNLVGAVFALLMVSWAAQPPDEGHPYGHHKAEYFSSGFEGVLIVAAAIAIVGAAGERLFHPAAVNAIGLGIALSLASTVLNGGLAWAMLRKAAQERVDCAGGRRQAPDHRRVDLRRRGGGTGRRALHRLAVARPGGGGVRGRPTSCREGVSLVWRSADGLMDMALEPDVRAQIDRTLAAFDAQPIRFDHVVTRRAGQRRYIDLHMHVPAAWTLGRAAALRAEVERALMRDVAGLRTSIQLLPTDVEAYVDEHATGARPAAS